LHRLSACNVTMVSLFALFFGLLSPPPARAQYMYLDTNGDGQSTEADVVSPTGTTVVDVWLRTDRNRAGAAAVCPTADGLMTINSYEFILQPSEGSVSWGAITNRMPFSINLGTSNLGSYLHVGYGSGTVLPPGTYRLATVALSVGSGAPAIEIVSSSPVSGAYGTNFGSSCSGNDFDNTLKLGSDWFDIDGALWGGSPNRAPVFAAIPTLVATEGQTSALDISAPDPDGAMVQFGKGSGPDYLTVLTINAAAGAGRLQATPSYLDAGIDSAVISATDGFRTSLASVRIEVANRPAPPALSTVGNMRVLAGGTADQTISAFDADGDAGQITFQLVSGPSFASLTTLPMLSPSTAQGQIHLAPSTLDLGTTSATVAAIKGTLRDEAVFQIGVLAVAPANRPCAISEMVSVTMPNGTTRNVPFSVYDPDGDVLSARLVSGQSFATVVILTSSPGSLSGSIVLRPGAADIGDHAITLGAYDGIAETRASFVLHVLGSSLPRFTVLRDMSVGAELSAAQTVWATTSDPDATYLTFSKASGPGYVSVQPQNGYPTYAYAVVTLRPTLADVGSATAQIAVSDGVHTATAPMQIEVRPTCPSMLAASLAPLEGARRSLVGDIDGDHVVDLLGFSFRTNEALVRLGSGDGTFREGPALTIVGGAAASLLVDLNGDGRADLVTAGGVNEGVLVRLATGGGAFGPPLATPIAGYPHSPEALSAADMDSDGRIDLIVGDGGTSPAVRVLLGVGDGTFTLAGSAGISSPLMTVATGDVNRDGHEDVVVGQYYSSSLLVIHGNGVGGFGSIDVYPDAGYSAHSAAVGDLNGDAWPDLVLAHDQLSVWLNDGAGGFRPAWKSAAPYRLWSVAVGEVTGDGRNDVVTTGEEWFDQTRGSVLVFAGIDADSLASPTGTIFDRHVIDAALADLDGDGRTDLVATGQEAILAYFNLGCRGMVDQAPRLVLLPDASAAEAAPFEIRVFAADPDAEPIQSLTMGPIPTGASFLPASDARSGTLSWTPGYDQAGEYDLTFLASNALTGSATAHIRVANTDRAPVVVAPVSKVVCAGAQIAFFVTATDPDSDGLTTLTAAPLPPGATFQVSTDRASGEFRWSTSAGSVGSHDIEFRATNSLSGSTHTQIVVGEGSACGIPFALENPDTSASAGLENAIQVDAQGFPHIAYTVASGRLRYVVKSAAGWIVEEVPQSGSASGLALALDSAGEPWIAFQSVETINFSISFRTKVAYRSQGEWNVETVGGIYPSSTGNVAIAFDPAGAPHVVYSGFPNFGIQYASRNGSAWSSEVVFLATEGLSDFGLEFDGQGAPHVVASTLQGILHARRGVGGWSTEFRPGSRPALALDASGQPHVVSYVIGVSPVMMQYQSRANDGVWNTEDVGPVPGPYPPRSSLRLNTAGGPLIAFPDLQEGLLKLIRKAGSAWRIYLVDAGGVGPRVSLALAAGANPRISYSGMSGLHYAAGDIPPNQAPASNPGGPYAGSVGVSLVFDGSASTDPEGAELTYAWDFGDDHQANGDRVEHAYASPGSFRVTLSVSDGELTGSATTTASVTTVLPARAFLLGASRVLPLVPSDRPSFCVQIEPEGGAFQVQDLVPESFTLRADSTGAAEEIGVRDSKGASIGDRDHNGVAEMTVCFASADLASLLGPLEGRTEVILFLEGALQSGARVRAALTVPVLPVGPLSARAYPNPMNPTSRLSLVLPRPGRLRAILFDVSGKMVRVLADEHRAAAGVREIAIDGRDRHGRPLATGVYFYRVESDGEVLTGQIAVIK
jgi:hypothetical protein